MAAETTCSFCTRVARFKCEACGEPYCSERCFAERAHDTVCPLGSTTAVGEPKGGERKRAPLPDVSNTEKAARARRMAIGEEFDDLAKALEYLCEHEPHTVERIGGQKAVRMTVLPNSPVSGQAYRIVVPDPVDAESRRTFVAAVLPKSTTGCWSNQSVDILLEDASGEDELAVLSDDETVVWFSSLKDKSCIHINQRIWGGVWIDLLMLYRHCALPTKTQCGTRTMDGVFAIIRNLLLTLRYAGPVYLHDAMSYNPEEEKYWDEHYAYPSYIARLLARTKTESVYAKYGFVAVDGDDDPVPPQRDLAGIQEYAMRRTVRAAMIADVKRDGVTLAELSSREDAFPLVDKPLADLLEYFVPTPLRRRLSPVDVQFYNDLLETIMLYDDGIEKQRRALDKIMSRMLCKDYRESWRNVCDKK